MGNVRVFNLARDLNLSSQEVIERLRKLGVEVKTASSSVDEDTADKLKRALKIDALTARKKRIYGSDEDEAERETQERQLQERIAAEREAREKAAAEAKKAAEARKVAKAHGPKDREADKTAAKAVAVDEPPPALQHAPGAPRLAPKVTAPPPAASAQHSSAWTIAPASGTRSTRANSTHSTWPTTATRTPPLSQIRRVSR